MYNELVYHLDLCILSYHLYTQTLIWPIDPYYEQMARKGTDRRDNFMAKVRSNPPRVILRSNPPRVIYSCPEHLDPIVSDYQRINPWKPCFVSPEPHQWLVFQAPLEITQPIRSIYFREIEKEDYPPHKYKDNPNPTTGNDYLYCFEGETGQVMSDDFPPKTGLKSMMGFILDKQIGGDEEYNIHIVFRGSRSGSGARAASQAVSSKGNPDWVTDIDSVRKLISDPVISPYGKCSRGFCNSVKTMIEPIASSLRSIHNRRKRPPRRIFITGHSLGGALAALCASAFSLSLRNILRYGKDDVLKNWPWDSLALITFGAPAVGDKDFHYAVNSKVYAKRIVLGTDPITQKRILYHVGARTNLPGNGGFDDHKPDCIREALIKWEKNLGFDGEFPNPPWQEFRNFNEVLGKIARSEDIQAALGASFTDHLRSYLTILSDTLSLDSSYKTGYLKSASSKATKQNIINNLTNGILDAPIDYNLSILYQYWTSERNNLDDTSLSNFLGLCILLHGYEKQPNTVMLLVNRNYSDLKGVIDIL